MKNLKNKFNQAHLVEQHTIYLYVVEGKAETHIMDTLVENDLLIEQFKVFGYNHPENKYKARIQNMSGKNNLTITKIRDAIPLKASEWKRVHIVVLADDIVKTGVSLDKTNEDKEQLKTYFGENYNDRITYISVKPTVETLLISYFDCVEEFNESNQLPLKFISSKYNLKEKEIKSKKNWEKWINEENISRVINKCNDIKIYRFKKDKKEQRNIIHLHEIIEQ